MTTYWHLASADYTEGSDLMSFVEQVERGTRTEADWRWEHAYGSGGDERVVSLFATAAAALEWLDFGAPAGCRVVRVEIPEDHVCVRVFAFRNGADAHPAVMDRIPGAMCTVVDAAALEAAAEAE